MKCSNGAGGGTTSESERREGTTTIFVLNERTRAGRAMRAYRKGEGEQARVERSLE